jgi:hypothetical protein
VTKQKSIIWERIPRDPARRYRNTQDHNQVISRRYFDEHYGRLSKLGLTQEAYAKKNAIENPLQSQMRPRRGQKHTVPKYNKKLERAILKSARLAKFKDNIKIGEYEFAPNLANLMEVFYTLLRIKTRTRMLYYIETKEIDENKNITHTSLTRYAYLPTTAEKMISIWEEIENFDNRYGIPIRVITTTIHYRYGV